MKNSSIPAYALTILFALGANFAQAVGFQHLKLDASELEVGIWYPSIGQTTSQSMGLITQNVAVDGPVEGSRLPLIVISHGTGSSFLGHYDTAIALAEAGYVVASVTHTGDNYADQSRSIFIMDRPKQISLVIDYIIHAWNGHTQVDPMRIGMFGFSAGGFTTLVNIGGVPDLRRIAPFCKEHIGDFACQMLARSPDTKPNSLATQSAISDARIKAAVVAAPALGFTFSREGLQNVTIPVQLWRAEDDNLLPNPWYAEAVRLALPQAPDYHVIPKAGHFDFLAPCTEALLARAPAICTSAPDFNRKAFHVAFNASIIEFFGRTLKSGN